MHPDTTTSRVKTVVLTAAAVAALDQATKAAVLACFAPGESVAVVPGFFDLCLVLNRGAAWGILAGRRVLLVAVSAAMLALLWFSRRDLGSTRAGRVASGLLGGGIVGNLIDRAFRGEVVDFLDFHIGREWSWPAFNAADSAICIAVAILLIGQGVEAWFQNRR
ncbi:MAG: signal peptidase II [Kiritimatiellae bacterium]|nr:signal peptidase II [Kiritimatiellia bacterium]